MFKKIFKKKVIDKNDSKNIKMDSKTVKSILTTTFRDTVTGEIVEVPFGDHELFNKCMSNKNMQLIFN